MKANWIKFSEVWPPRGFYWCRFRNYNGTYGKPTIGEVYGPHLLFVSTWKDCIKSDPLTECWEYNLNRIKEPA